MMGRDGLKHPSSDMIKILNRTKPQWKDIVGAPEFRMAWILLGATIAVAILAVMGGTSLLFTLIEAGILVAVAILVGVSVYGAAAKERGSFAERSELKSILQSIEDALIVYDGNFRIHFFNPAAEKLFGIQARDALGHVLSPRDAENPQWRVLVQAVFPSLAPRVVVRTAANEVPQIIDLSLADPEREFRIATAPVVDESGRTSGFLKIIRDRTPQISALRAKDEFVTVASHQLRGPVTDINWALQTLAEAKELNETDAMIVTTAKQASENLLRRIEDLLAIARMEDGRVGYAFEATDLVEYVNGVLAGVLPAARKAGIKIYLDRPDAALPKVVIDKKQLSLALTNILENAVRYNVENGEVTVKVDRMVDKPYLVVSVRDTGIGIPPEDIPKLFEKFYRADNAVKAQTEGSGLGLYITKGIIEAHGGQIWAESELGRGTTISFALPTDPNLVPKREVSAMDLV
jgi:two-component system phosphate regulon sensor histidine kinase PhoR